MFGYFLMSVFIVVTGFAALYSERGQYAIFAPFRYVVEFFYWTGGDSMDMRSWHRLGDEADWRVCDGSCLHGTA